MIGRRKKKKVDPELDELRRKSALLRRQTKEHLDALPKREARKIAKRAISELMAKSILTVD